MFRQAHKIYRATIKLQTITMSTGKLTLEQHWYRYSFLPFLFLFPSLQNVTKTTSSVYKSLKMHGWKIHNLLERKEGMVLEAILACKYYLALLAKAMLYYVKGESMTLTKIACIWWKKGVYNVNGSDMWKWDFEQLLMYCWMYFS